MKKLVIGLCILASSGSAFASCPTLQALLDAKTAWQQTLRYDYVGRSPGPDEVLRDLPQSRANYRALFNRIKHLQEIKAITQDDFNKMKDSVEFQASNYMTTQPSDHDALVYIGQVEDQAAILEGLVDYTLEEAQKNPENFCNKNAAAADDLKTGAAAPLQSADGMADMDHPSASIMPAGQGTWWTAKDFCKNLQPQGTWRLPSKSDFNKMVKELRDPNKASTLRDLWTGPWWTSNGDWSTLPDGVLTVLLLQERLDGVPTGHEGISSAYGFELNPPGLSGTKPYDFISFSKTDESFQARCVHN